MTEVREKCQCVRIHDLPEEILERIMSYLSPYDDSKHASLVSKQWHRLMQGVMKQRKLAFQLAARAGALQWSHQRYESNCIMGRCMHSTCCVDDVMYMFGGTRPASPTYAGYSGGTCYCDLMKLDLGRRVWTRLLASGGYPSPKAAASLVHHKGSLILYGGWAPPVPSPLHQLPYISDELHIYDIVANRWKSVVSRVSPPALAHHRATMMGDLMVIFGGGRGVGKKENNVWVLSIQSMTWSCMEMNGRKPAARGKHVQVALDDGHILIVGGLDNDDKELTDVWMLDISEVPWCWREVDVNHPDQAAPKIYSHAASKIGDSVVFFSCLRTINPTGNQHAPLHFPRRPPQLQRPAMSSNAPHSSTTSKGGVERGSLRHLRRVTKRRCSLESASEESCSPSSETEDACMSSAPEVSDTGCPCSPDCKCKVPVTCDIHALPKRNCLDRVGSIPAKPDEVQQRRSSVPHGEQQYVLDVTSAVTDHRVTWLDIPDVNGNRGRPNPCLEDENLKYGRAPEAFFPSVCVGRAEVIRFGGILNDKRHPTVLNCQYFAY